MIVRPLVIAPAHVQPNLVGWHVDERRVDGGDHALDEALEILERSGSEGGVTLERQVRRIDLQLEAGPYDGLILEAQRRRDGIDIGVKARIMLILHDRGEDAGRRGRDEGGGCAPPETAVGRLEGGALGIELGLANVGDGTDTLGQEGNVAHRFALRQEPGALRLEFRVAFDIGKGRPLASAVNATQPTTQIEHEGFALLLAVGDDVEARLALLVDHPGDGLASGRGERGRVDCLALRSAREKVGQQRWPWQAPCVRRQDALIARRHVQWSSSNACISSKPDARRRSRPRSPPTAGEIAGGVAQISAGVRQPSQLGVSHACSNLQARPSACRGAPKDDDRGPARAYRLRGERARPNRRFRAGLLQYWGRLATRYLALRGPISLRHDQSAGLWRHGRTAHRCRRLHRARGRSPRGGCPPRRPARAPGRTLLRRLGGARRRAQEASAPRQPVDPGGSRRAVAGRGRRARHYRAFRDMTDAYFAAFAAGRADAIATMIDFYGGEGT